MKNKDLQIGDVFKSKKQLVGQIDGFDRELIIRIVNIKKSIFIFGNIITIKQVGKYHPWDFIIGNKNVEVITQRNLFKYYNFSQKLTNEYIIKEIIE